MKKNKPLLFICLLVISLFLAASQVLSASRLDPKIPDLANNKLQNTIHNPTIVVRSSESDISINGPYRARQADDPSCRLINFEGLGNLASIPAIDGILTPEWLAIIDEDAGGSGNFANEPSPNTVAFWLEGDDPTSRDIEFDNPVNKVSFFYSSFVATVLTAYDENGSIIDVATGSANFQSGAGGDPTGEFDKFDQLSVESDNGNKIVRVTVNGNTNQTGIDDLEVCTVSTIDSVEFTQVIQEYQTLEDFKADIATDKTPPVPIIANRSLALRVYMPEFDTSTDVIVRLSGVSNQTKSMTIQPNCTPEESRAGTNGCQSINFNFTPPQGDWSAKLEVLDDSNQIVDEHEFSLTSVETQPLVLRAVSVCDSRFLLFFWRCEDADELADLLGFLRKTAPTHEVRIEYPGDEIRLRTSSYSDKIDWWIDMVREVDDLGPENYYYGMVRPEVDAGSTGGIANGIPAGGAASRSSVVRLGVETNDQVVAHEVGHVMGRKHTNTNNPSVSGSPPGCYSTAQDGSTDWPFADNRIQSANGLEVGFDVDAGQPIDPNNTFDWMSYCVPRWITPHTFTKALSAVEMRSKAPMAPFEIDEFWKISGYISSTVTTFDPIFTYTTDGPIDQGSGTHRIEAIDGSSNVLFSRQFTPNEPHAEDEEPIGELDVYIFSELVPTQPNTVALVMFNEQNEEIGRMNLSGAQPSVAFTSPNTSGNLEGIQNVSWEINDTDSDRHTSWLEYSSDGGITWISLGKNLASSETKINFDSLPGSSSQSRFRVRVSDGINSAEALSSIFSVDKKQPMLEVLSPMNQSVYRATENVVFEAKVIDIEDGNLGENASWKSNIDGVLGSGSYLTSNNLSAGSHTITISAEDSDENQISQSLTIVVDETPPTIDLSIVLDGTPASCVEATINGQDEGGMITRAEFSIDGGENWQLLDHTFLPITFTVPGTGLIHFVARLTDHAGHQVSADEEFFIQSTCENQPPVADAGAGYTGIEGQGIQLNGSNSIDEDGEIISYNWDINRDGNYEDAIGITPTVSFPDNGDFPVSLLIIDTAGISATARTTVTVDNAPPILQLVTLDPIESESIFSFEFGTFSDSGALDTHFLTIDWGDGSAVADPVSVTSSIEGFHQYESVGDFIVDVCITDDDGDKSCDAVPVTVDEPAEPARRFIIYLPIIYK